MLLAAALAFYYPLVFLGRELVDYDAFVYFYPQRAYLAQALLEGRVPLWNPYLFMGVPFLANPQTAVLYPPSWLFLLTPVHVGYTVQLVLHGFLAALFTYLLATRAFGTSSLAGIVGGLSFAFGGFAVGQTGHLNQLSAAAWLPAVLLCYDRAVVLRSPAWAGLGALALALQVLAGHPQETYMTLLALVVYGAVRAPWRHPGPFVWAVVAGGVVGGLGVILAAAQLLPTLELVPLSIRGGGVQWRDAVAGSLPPYLLPRALFPPFWLSVASTEYLGYGGVVALTLGLLALLVARSRFAWFGAAMCCLGLFLAPGENNVAYRFLFDSVPGFDTFRVPARWLFLWQVGLAVLASLGADWMSHGARVSLRRRDLWPRLMLVSLVLAAGLAWQLGDGEPLGQRRTPAVWLAVACVTLLSGFLASSGARRVALGVVVSIAAVELWAAADASPARQAPPAAPFQEAPGSAAWLAATMGETGRMLSVAQASYIPSNEASLRTTLEGMPEPVIEAAIVATKWREVLNPNLPLQFGLRSADGYDGGVLPLNWFVRFSALAVPPLDVRPDGVLQSRLEDPPDARVLDLFGVQYVLANAEGPVSRGSEQARVGDLRVVTRPDAAPLAQLVYRASVATNDADALARLGAASFEPRQEIVLAESDAAASLSGNAPGQAVEPTSGGPERWQARVSLPADGYLLQREAWYPGWRARVDGVEVPMLRANVLFRAIPVPRGDHVVDVSFEPASFERGARLTAAGLAVLVVLLAWPVWRRYVPIIRGRGR